ncbi:heat shock protein HtpX [Geothermobacter ehrlichii]|uniref:Heat shock protein HtpX n=1 Tax=Geothermobacter ehrlichii TaxID=213224 RepID=A0A5D3WLW6_9BACT|nr:zinc metalloprotease HtpX [Geothermobacter ehrlichii]TYO99183.1 heat shock protein HtpX [Geothermobacter ehrlichii]
MTAWRIDGHAWLYNLLRNRLHSLLLLACTVAIPALAEWLLWGRDGLLVLVPAVFLVLLIGVRISPRLVMRFYRARPLSPFEAPQLYRLVEELAIRAELEQIPALYLLQTPMVNAFAVGDSRDAAVAVTSGLLQTLDQRELAGVLAHEISHIRNRDLRLMALAGWSEQITGLLAGLGLLLVLFNLPRALAGQVQINWTALSLLLAAPYLSTLLQRGLSRVREFDADLTAVMLTGDPEGLARALARLEWRERSFWRRMLGPAPGDLPYLLRTHPPTEERIRRLSEVSCPGRIGGRIVHPA